MTNDVGVGNEVSVRACVIKVMMSVQYGGDRKVRHLGDFLDDVVMAVSIFIVDDDDFGICYSNGNIAAGKSTVETWDDI